MAASPTHDPPAGRRWALAVAGVLVIAAALRVPPLAVLVPGTDLQENYVRQAIVAVAAESWAPTWPWHGPGFFTFLRAFFTVWYAVGWLGGWWADRIDMLASFLGWPYPFLLAARVIVVGSALATIATVAHLGRVAFGRVAGVTAALALAVMLTHVRESLQVWPDVPAAALVLAAVATAHGGRRPLVAALLAGAAIACKHSAAPVVLPIAIGLLVPPYATLWRRVLATGAGLAAAYVVLGHTVATHPLELLATMRVQAMVSFAVESNDLTFAQILSIGIGWPLVGLAILGAATALRGPDRRRTLLLLAFPVAYLITIAGAGRLFARYVVLAAPFIALFAGEGIAVVSRFFGRRRELVAATLLAVACLLPLRRSLAYMRSMTRPDTRILAGEWIAAHAPENGVVVLPHILAAPNPLIPGVVSPRVEEVPAAREVIDAARARLEGRGGRRLRVYTLGGFGRVAQVQFNEPAIVVTAAHPTILNDQKLHAAAAQALLLAHAQPVATFESLPVPLPPDVLFDPIDSDYTPLLGADHLERPGPTLTVWSVPARRQ